MIKKSKHAIISSTKEILGGEPVFKGTRVPVRTLVEYLKAGDRLKDFLSDYPSVTRKQALEVLDLARESISQG